MNKKTNKNFMADNEVAPNFQIQDAMMMMMIMMMVMVMVMMMMMMIFSRLNMSIAVDYILFVVKK
jgi:hypothetical protein